MLLNLELVKYNIKGKRYLSYFIIIIIIIIIIYLFIYLFYLFIYLFIYFLSRSAERIIIYNLFLWHKGSTFRVSRATANLPRLLILSGASWPGSWTPSDSISFP